MVIKYSPCGVSLFHPCCQSRCAGTDVVSTAQEKRHGLLLKDKGLNADSTSTHWVLSCESPSPGISLTSQEAGVLGGDCARRHYEDSPGVELHCFPPLLHQSQNSACSFLLAGVWGVAESRHYQSIPGSVHLGHFSCAISKGRGRSWSPNAGHLRRCQFSSLSVWLVFVP